MDQSLDVTDIKAESTSSNRIEIPTEMQLKSVKLENINSELDIKTEIHQNENEFPVIASTSYNLCSNYDMKIETKESLIQIEYENPVDELIQDPLDVRSEIKVEKHLPIDLDESEPRIKTEPIEGENNKSLSECTDKDNSQGSSSNYVQEQLLIRKDPDRKDKKHNCNECNKTFKLKGDLNRHLRSHTGIKPYTCDVCEKLFNRKSHLDEHKLIHSGEKAHFCDLCKKVFSRKSHLDSHKLIHSGVKSFSCDVCEKSFMQKPHLVRHQRIHTGEKPFICDLCNKAFTNKSTLIQHGSLHTGQKPYSCGNCNKSFAQTSGLSLHKRNHKH